MADGVRKDEEFSGTKPVEERHRIDEMQPRRAGCARTSKAIEGPLTVLQFKGGQSNPTYRLDTPEPLLRDAAQAVRQTAAVGACGRSRVPRHRRAGKAGLSGRARLCAVHRRRRDRLRPSTSCRWRRAGCSGIRRCRARRREDRRKIFTSKIETLAKLHMFDPDTIGLADFGKPGNYFARQVDRWTKQYRASETQHIPEVEKADRVAAEDRCRSRSASRSSMATIASTT